MQIQFLYGIEPSRTIFQSKRYSYMPYVQISLYGTLYGLYEGGEDEVRKVMIRMLCNAVQSHAERYFNQRGIPICLMPKYRCMGHYTACMRGFENEVRKVMIRMLCNAAQSHVERYFNQRGIPIYLMPKYRCMGHYTACMRGLKMRSGK